MDAAGRQVERFTSLTPLPGCASWCVACAEPAVVEVAIERPDGPVVDALLDAGLTVVVIARTSSRTCAPLRLGRQQGRPVRRLRAGRHAAHRPARLRPLTRDSPATDHAADDRAAPARTSSTPGSRWPTSSARTCSPFPRRHRAVPRHRLRDQPAVPDPLPRQDQADWLSAKRLGHWLRSRRLQRPRQPRGAARPAAAAPRGTTGTEATPSAAHHPGAASPRWHPARPRSKPSTSRSPSQLAAHPDAAIFTTLPRSGTVRAARLLAEIGDCPRPFPTPEALACLAGAAPSTRSPARSKSSRFRWACDKQLRDAVIDFAGDSRHANPWAADLYHRARARGHDHPHAVRILARAWLHVIWRCWQDGVAYDPAKHNALQPLLAEQDKIIQEVA